jgi:hypothetical protein
MLKTLKNYSAMIGQHAQNYLDGSVDTAFIDTTTISPTLLLITVHYAELARLRRKKQVTYLPTVMD